MRTVIAGGREYTLTAFDYERLNSLRDSITEVISGACPSGVDRETSTWARTQGIPVRQFPADWATHGKAAGPIRNRAMAEYAEAVVLFPGGRGTASMEAEARRSGKLIFDWRNA